MNRNIIFYFKKLDYSMSIQEPKFDSIPSRKGFTAVEWGGVIDDK